MAKVSVIIPAYNAAQFIELACRSAVAQTHPDMEVIVIDDGSKDATASIAESIPGVTCIRKPNGGVSSARNVGMRASVKEFKFTGNRAYYRTVEK